MSARLTIILAVVFMLTMKGAVSEEGGEEMVCHYSCETCQFQFYVYCKSCSNGNQLRVIQDPNHIDDQYISSDYPTGTCTQQASQPNPLGIIILVTAILGLSISRSNQLFYMIFTLQTFSLLSLIEVSQTYPLSYVLSALQYLMPCNVLTQRIKVEDWFMRRQSFYRLYQYFRGTDVQGSLTFLGVLSAAVVVYGGTVVVGKWLKEKLCEDSCRMCPVWLLEKQINFCTTLFFLLIQETVLSIVIDFRFSLRPSFPVLAIYISILFLYILLISKIKIPFFTNKFLQFHSLSKKIIYPVFLVIDFDQQYTLFIIITLNYTLELLFDCRNNEYPLKSFMAVYKIGEGVIIVMGIAYYFVEMKLNQESSSVVTGYLFMLAICVFLFLCYVEISLQIYVYFTNEKQRSNAIANEILPSQSSSRGKKAKSHEKTEEDILAHMELPVEITLDKKEEISSKKGSRKLIKEEEQQDQQQQIKEEEIKVPRPRRLERDPNIEERKKRMNPELKKRYGIK